MFPSKLAPGAVSAAQQRAQDFRMRLSLMEQETGGCRHCGDPVVSADLYGERVYLVAGRGLSIEVFENSYGRMQLEAICSPHGRWERHRCAGGAA